MIRSCSDRDTEELFFTGKSRRFGSIASVARRKLQMLDNTRVLDDLKLPTDNRWESLKGDRKNQYSVRINQQYRICFVWRETEPHEVEIVDYH